MFHCAASEVNALNRCRERVQIAAFVTFCICRYVRSVKTHGKLQAFATITMPLLLIHRRQMAAGPTQATMRSFDPRFHLRASPVSTAHTVSSGVRFQP
jgi:hypothetical protein